MALIDGTYALITSSVRDIGGIIPNVAVEEMGSDVLRITDHPCEVGATISDHAFKMPVEITMRCGWSDSSGGFEGYSAAVYQSLLQLQASRTPFNVSTGKRFYQNMLIGGIHTMNDETTEHALVATVACREVIITSTQAGQVAAANQTNPQQAADPVNTGLQPLQTNPSMPAFTQIPQPLAA